MHTLMRIELDGTAKLVFPDNEGNNNNHNNNRSMRSQVFPEQSVKSLLTLALGLPTVG